MGISLWHVYWVKDCQYTNPVKDKMVIPVCEIDGIYLGILINSRISDYVRVSEERLDCQGTILKSDHPFLKWDSIVACHEPYEFDVSDFSKKAHPLSVEAKKNILYRIQICKTIIRRYKRAILISGGISI